MTAVAKSDEVINFRTTKGDKKLIDSAAAAVGKKRTEFILDTVRDKAHEVLADRTRFRLTPAQLARFNQLLDEPVSEATIRLLSRRAPWDE